MKGNLARVSLCSGTISVDGGSYSSKSILSSRGCSCAHERSGAKREQNNITSECLFIVKIFYQDTRYLITRKKVLFQGDKAFVKLSKSTAHETNCPEMAPAIHLNYINCF